MSIPATHKQAASEQLRTRVESQTFQGSKRTADRICGGNRSMSSDGETAEGNTTGPDGNCDADDEDDDCLLSAELLLLLPLFRVGERDEPRRLSLPSLSRPPLSSRPRSTKQQIR